MAVLAIRGVIREFAKVTLVSVGTGFDTLKGDVLVFQADRVGGRFGRSRSMRAWLRRNTASYDLVLINSIFDGTSIAASKAAFRAGVPYLIWPHGSLDPIDLRKHSTMKRLLAPIYWRRMIGRSSALVFASNVESRNADSFVRGVPRFVLDLPMPVVRERSRDRQLARKSLNLPQDVPILLYLGRLDAQKGVTLLFEAITDPMLSGMHLAVAGRGEARFERFLKSEADRLAIEDRVHWLGWLEGDSKVAAFDAADCFALVSENESFGIAAVEAVQHGCPVLVSEGVNISAELAAARAAVVVPRQTDAIRQGLQHLLKHPEMLAPERSRIDFANQRWSATGLRARYESMCRQFDLQLSAQVSSD